MSVNLSSKLLKCVVSTKNIKLSYSRWSSAALPASVPRRVVVTGLGTVSPLGCGTQYAWHQLLEGKCGIVKLEDENYAKLSSRVAGLVPRGKADFELDLEKHFNKSDLRAIAPATAFALIAANEALTDANWFPEEETERDNTGVCIGMGMVNLNDVIDAGEALKKSSNRVSPHFIPRILLNMASGHVSMKYGFRGPNHSISTACATGSHAIGDSSRLIRDGAADVMICGGCESTISPLSVAAFCRLRALSTSYNDQPEKASRPFDEARDGFVIGEGAACLVLEELEHAEMRGAKIYAEVLGYGMSGDAFHSTSPSTDGRGAALAMQRALNYADILPEDVGYINAHATSTPAGDDVEVKAIKSVFGDHAKYLAVSGTKGAHGHLLGAAGSLESVFTVLACHTGNLPPTLNLDNTSPDMDLNFVPHKTQLWPDIACDRRIALKNSFGFGGTNVSLCFAQYEI
jgi:3-oxoacyl-[acyl-carrier-protein] synthase II